jgi:Ca2+-binding RTX toxin-like protein
MAYSFTGTSGPDTIDMSGQTGPGKIYGLAGKDFIKTGKGAVTVDGGADEDVIVLQAGNTGTAMGGSEDDWITSDGALGAMALYGNGGADTIIVTATAAQTVIGGDNGNDGNDSILVGSPGDFGDYLWGAGGNDTLWAGMGNDTYVGGSGDDSILAGDGSDLVSGNEGNDVIEVSAGNDTVFAGTGNDYVRVSGADHPLFYLEEGADTLAGEAATGAMTVHGGNDSFDGNDSIVTGSGADFVYGNGGNDTILAHEGANTVMGDGGLAEIGIIKIDGNDSIVTGSGADLVYGDGGNDTIRSNDGNDTVMGGIGYDSIMCTDDADNLLFGNEGADTIASASGNDAVYGGEGRDSLAGGASDFQMLVGEAGGDTLNGRLGRDTLTGGSDADVFYYGGASDDGDGLLYIQSIFTTPTVEVITDVNFDEDRLRVSEAVGFAGDVGVVNAANLGAAATYAMQVVLFFGGGGSQHVAAQFTFNGREYLAIDQGGSNSAFSDAQDLLMEITGATGTLGANDFII